MKKKVIKHLLTILAIAFVFTLGSLSGLVYLSKANSQPANAYESFILESFNLIKENYWKKLSEKELSQIFQNALETTTFSPNAKRVENKKQFLSLFKKELKKLPKEKKKELSVKLVQNAVASLDPKGKSQLLSKKQKEELVATVKNVDKEKKLLKELGVDERTSPEEVEKKAAEKIKELEKEAKFDKKAREKLKEVKLAQKTLTDKQKRELYLKQNIVPTIIFEPLTSDIHYLKISRFSPQTWQEFYSTFSNPQETSATTLIIDLRGNIGGAIDILPYFLGPFIGPGNIAYEFFHQGDYTPFRTKTGWLPGLYPYKKVVVLIDSKMQSSAEVVASTFKKYNVGVLVGERTRGWGTVETILPLKTKLEGESYTLLLVSNLTLREDNQPIEGRGVEPHIKISDPNWKNELLKYFNYPTLVNVVDKLWKGEIGY